MKRISVSFAFMLLAMFNTFTASAQQLDEKLMLQLVNEARTKGCRCAGKKLAPVAPLVWNDKLEMAATAHTKDMESKSSLAIPGQMERLYPYALKKQDING